MNRATCTFSVKGWDEKPFGEAEGQLRLTHTSVTKTYSGDLQGEGVLHYLMYYGPKEQTRVIGLERVTGAIGGRSGSFVLEHDGADDGAEARETITILPGSGTGGLAGISGDGETVATRKGELTMSLEYELP
jgi:hypothetical protein